MDFLPFRLSEYHCGNRPSSIDDLSVSFLIYNRKCDKLIDCLRFIFEQPIIKNFEVIICDDASDDGAWPTACRFTRDYKDKITLSRNNVPMGKEANRLKGLQMCMGNCCIDIAPDADLNSDSLERLLRLEKNDEMMVPRIWHLVRSNIASPPFSPIRDTFEGKNDRKPFVFIRLINYNYGRYLRQCFDSVFAQTWQNFEISFSDNASTDDSWAIALEYADKYPGRISLTRNRMNFGAKTNIVNCKLNSRGKYTMILCSDDALVPTFLERTVSALEAHKDCAFVMVHRDIMDERGEITHEPSFYDQSCRISGEEQAAVYMMSSVNPCISQILYNLEKEENKQLSGNLNSRWLGSRIQDFLICCESPILYIKDSLLLNRVHEQSDGAKMYGNLLQCLSEYVLLHQLDDIAGTFKNMEKVHERLPKGIEKLGRLCLRYCLRCLLAQDERTARRYFHLAAAFFPEIEEDPLYLEFAIYWTSNTDERKKLREQLSKKFNLEKRTISYPPPPGSTPL